jgi:hypothetical protein
LTVLSHSGDACNADTIKFPAGLGQIVFKGFSCPIHPGKVSLALDTTVSGSVPSKFARLNIQLTAQSSSGDKILCVNVKTAPAEDESAIAEDMLEEYWKALVSPSFVDGGSVKLSFTDCGDSSTHGHITSLSPATLTLGAKTSVAGKGSVDEAVPGATYKVVAKALGVTVFSHTGDACKPETIQLPAGSGQIDMKGFACPISTGSVELDLDITLSANIPAKLARTTIDLTATAASGDKTLCVQIKTSPADETIVV